MSPVECLIALSTFGSLSTESTGTSIKALTENVARPTLCWHTADVALDVARNALTCRVDDIAPILHRISEASLECSYVC